MVYWMLLRLWSQDATSTDDNHFTDPASKILRIHGICRWSLLLPVPGLFDFSPWTCLALSFQYTHVSCGCSSSLDTWRYFGFSCTTTGEHHVTGSSAGTSSNNPSSTHWSSHNFSGFWRQYGTGLGLWATGAVFAFMLNWTYNSLLFFMSLIFPIPSKTLLNLLVISCIAWCDLFVVTVRMSNISPGIRMSFWFAKEPSSFICSIPSSITVFLLISGGEFILPFMTRNFVRFPHVWFLRIASNSPFIGRSFCSVRNFVWLFWSSILLSDLCSSALYWYSSMTFTSAPVSGSALMWMSFIINGIVFSNHMLSLPSWFACALLIWSGIPHQSFPHCPRPSLLFSLLCVFFGFDCLHLVVCYLVYICFYRIYRRLQNDCISNNYCISYRRLGSFSPQNEPQIRTWSTTDHDVSCYCFLYSCVPLGFAVWILPPLQCLYCLVQFSYLSSEAKRPRSVLHPLKILAKSRISIYISESILDSQWFELNVPIFSHHSSYQSHNHALFLAIALRTQQWFLPCPVAFSEICTWHSVYSVLGWSSRLVSFVASGKHLILRQDPQGLVSFSLSPVLHKLW